MKDPIFSGTVDGREDSGKALALLFSTEKRNQIDGFAFDCLVDPLSLSVGTEFLDCGLDDWHTLSAILPHSKLSLVS